MLQKIGSGGPVAGYAVLILGDVVMIERDGALVDRRRVEGMGRFTVSARSLKLGWGRFPDGAEVIYLYDADDGGFGYAVNLASPACSEWRYAPFAA